MGHDITAYVKTKADRDPDSSGEEVAYFRISAFNTIRQRLFYGILPRAESANGGVSGTGETIRFTRDDIAKAMDACEYFMEDDQALRDVVVSKQHGQEKTTAEFRDLIDSVFGTNVDYSSLPTENADPQELRLQLADIWEFLNDILTGYDEVRKFDPSAQIRIDFW